LDISGKIEIISRFKNVKHQSWKWRYSSSSPHKDLKGANCARSMPDTDTRLYCTWGRFHCACYHVSSRLEICV